MRKSPWTTVDLFATHNRRTRGMNTARLFDMIGLLINI